MLDTLQAWDEALLLLLNGQPVWLAQVAWMLTSKWATVPVALLILFKLFARRTWRHGLTGLLLLLACVAGTDAISSRLFKPGFARPRPSHAVHLSHQLSLHTQSDGTAYRGGPYGFVSSHAANTFGLAALASLLFGGGRWRWLYVFATAVSWTRIYGRALSGTFSLAHFSAWDRPRPVHPGPSPAPPNFHTDCGPMNALSLPFLLGIFLGGGAGSVLRHLLGVWLNGRHTMPLGTLAANLLATALLAFITLRVAERFPEGHVLPAALAIGLCGGFSTFSTFSADNHRLFAEGQWMWGTLNIAVSILGCIAVFALVAGWVRR